MQLTAQLKPISELKSLEGFIGESVGRLNFKDNVNITSKMLNKSLIELTYNKDWKAFSDGEYEYSLEWLTNITVSDEKLKLSLEIKDLTLTVRILEMDESLRNKDVHNGRLYKLHKDRFKISSLCKLAVEIDALYIHGVNKDLESATYTFQSHKTLTKWIRRLIKCK